MCEKNQNLKPPFWPFGPPWIGAPSYLRSLHQVITYQRPGWFFTDDLVMEGLVELPTCWVIEKKEKRVEIPWSTHIHYKYRYSDEICWCILLYKKNLCQWLLSTSYYQGFILLYPWVDSMPPRPDTSSVLSWWTFLLWCHEVCHQSDQWYGNCWKTWSFIQRCMLHGFGFSHMICMTCILLCCIVYSQKILAFLGQQWVHSKKRHCQQSSMETLISVRVSNKVQFPPLPMIKSKTVFKDKSWRNANCWLNSTHLKKNNRFHGKFT